MDQKTIFRCHSSIISNCLNHAATFKIIFFYLVSRRSSESILSTLNLIGPSYTIRATIFEKVFWPEKFPKTEYFPSKRIISLSIYLVSFQAEPGILTNTGLIWVCKEIKITAPLMSGVTFHFCQVFKTLTFSNFLI